MFELCSICRDSIVLVDLKIKGQLIDVDIEFSWGWIMFWIGLFTKALPVRIEFIETARTSNKLYTLLQCFADHSTIT